MTPRSSVKCTGLVHVQPKRLSDRKTASTAPRDPPHVLGTFLRACFHTLHIKLKGRQRLDFSGSASRFQISCAHRRAGATAGLQVLSPYVAIMAEREAPRGMEGKLSRANLRNFSSSALAMPKTSEP